MLGVLKFMGFLLLAALVVGLLQFVVGIGYLMNGSVVFWIAGGAIVVVLALIWVIRQAGKIRW